MKNYQVSKEEFDDFYYSCKTERNRLYEEIKHIQNKISHLSDLILKLERKKNILSKSRHIDPTKTLVYNPKGKWKDKLIYILRKLNEPLTVKGIILVLKNLDPSFIENKNSTSTLLVALKSYPHEIVKFKLQKGKFFFGLAEWFDDKLNLKEEYKKKIL